MNELLYLLAATSLLSLISPLMRGAVIWNVLASAVVFCCSGMLAFILWYSQATGVSFSWQLGPFVLLSYRLDDFASYFIVLLSGLWPIAVLYSYSYLRAIDHEAPKRFMFFYNAAVVASMLIAISANLTTMFIHYELLTISTIPLIGEIGTEHAKKALGTYLKYLLLGSLLFFLPAIIILQSYIADTEFTLGGIIANAGVPSIVAKLLFLMFLFGIAKASLMPMHQWLPAAMVAYHPVSALLHAVAVVNAGLFCLLRITYYIFGREYLAALFKADHIWLLLIPTTTIIISAIIARYEDTLKKLLAYSTVSQLALVVLCSCIFSEGALYASFLYMVIHSVAKIGLFFCAGNIYVLTKYTRIEQLAGLYKTMPQTVFVFVLCGLALIGIPPLSGFWGKYHIIYEALSRGMNAPSYLIIGVVVMSSLLSAWYIMNIIMVFYRQDIIIEHNLTHFSERQTPMLMKLMTIKVAVLVLIVSILVA